jgi:glycosyltransferase involved in cell wall biosynthesis
MTAFPRVVLLILTYNHADCIAYTIEQIKNQSYENFKLFIVDDNSSDDTHTIVSFAAVNDDRITVLRNSRNLGFFDNFDSSLNHLLLIEPDFDYFSLLGPDDEWAPKWLEEVVQCMELNRGISVSQSYVEYNSEFKKEIRQYTDIAKEEICNKSGKLLRVGYGELIHGIWSKKAVMEFRECRKLLSASNLLKMENFLVAVIINVGGFKCVPQILHAKNKQTGSKVRYKEILFYQNPGKILKTIIKSFIPTWIFIARHRSGKRFLFQAWLLDLRISLYSVRTEISQ